MASTIFTFGGVSFDPSKDIPSLKGKVILVTGGSSGLGRASVLEFARHEPAHIWLAARSADKAQAAILDIKTKVPNATITALDLDLASLESVKAAARTFVSASDRLDILMLNAGVMATPPGLTQDGYEIQFGTNHVGHALLAKLLLPTLLKTAEMPESDVRCIAVSSWGHNMAPKEGIQFESMKTTQDNISTWQRYGESKLGNILFAREMAKRYPQITSIAAHPGAVATNLGHESAEVSRVSKALSFIYSRLASSPTTGVKNQLWASIAKDVKNGAYYVPVGLGGKESALAKDDALAKKLWEWTDHELKGYEL